MTSVHRAILLVLCGLQFGLAVRAEAGSFAVYRGAADASAAAVVGGDMFVLADDEDNALRVYNAGQGSLPISTYDLGAFLGVEAEHPEADIEGAARVGERIYWITSHGRNKDGKMRPNRYRFFAAVVKVENGSVTFSPVGTPCRTLAQEMARAEVLRPLRLDRVTAFGEELKKKERERLAPKNEGLNIEGLCATPDGKTLYIGLRNPQLDGKAIIIPLANPQAVIEEGARPVFEAAILLELGGRGIRSMEYRRADDSYLIIAGPVDEESDFALSRWRPEKQEQQLLVSKLGEDVKGFTPEALIIFEETGRVMVLSDDGTMPVEISDPSECADDGGLLGDGKCLNKYLRDQNRKSFRGMFLAR